MAQGWNARQVRKVACALRDLEPQPDAHQTPFKCSFELGPREALAFLPLLADTLHASGIDHQLVYSSDRDLDVLPAAAGKGRALRYVADRLGVPYIRVLACGDSGNDRDLVAHGGPAAMVGNALPELASWAPRDVFRAEGTFANGILEALGHFGWLGLAAGV